MSRAPDSAPPSTCCLSGLFSLLLSSGGFVSCSVFFLSIIWLIPLLPTADSFFLDLSLKLHISPGQVGQLVRASS